MRARILGSLSLLVLGLSLSASVASAQVVSSRVCKDGTLSAVTGRGACTGHGGVDAKATEKARKAADRAAMKSQKSALKAEKKEEKKLDRAEEARGATAQCKDGTYSRAKSTRGACSGHGGISRVLKS